LRPGTFSNETTQDGVWERCPAATSTACTATTNTGGSYTLSASDPVGNFIRLKETATNASASTTVWSNAIGPITPVSVSTPWPPGDPLGGDTFYVNPSDSAVTEENQLRATGQTATAGQIQTIASQPEATWLTSDGSTSVVPGIMSAAASSATVPVLVLYNIPWRDCGQYSSGGASSSADYEGFINSVASGLGQGRAVVIVEPDALSELSCLSSSQQQTYYQLIGCAAQKIDSDANASVYVDAGNPGWLPAATEASELQQALGTTKAGFAVNVSNFDSTAADVAFGTAISQAAGGRHFVIDTSRNGGNAASGQWCNPPGAGVGVDPTINTANPLVDADLWIKDVGESDGTCNGGPAAGQFWLSYALELVANG
jgi:endoglucanase